MNDENMLREKARTGIRTGKLPARRPDRMWGGPGTGAHCALCGEPVERKETGFDLEFARDGEPGACVNHQMHVRCFAAWERERDMKRDSQVNGGPAEALPIPAAHGTITARERDNTHNAEPG